MASGGVRSYQLSPRVYGVTKYHKKMLSSRPVRVILRPVDSTETTEPTAELKYLTAFSAQETLSIVVRGIAVKVASRQPGPAAGVRITAVRECSSVTQSPRRDLQ